jgi:hypothetical protein
MCLIDLRKKLILYVAIVLDNWISEYAEKTSRSEELADDNYRLPFLSTFSSLVKK